MIEEAAIRQIHGGGARPVLVCVAFFMGRARRLDRNVALPTIAIDLELSQSTLQWIITAYSLAFGGFLLLGGRAAGVFGRRRCS